MKTVWKFPIKIPNMGNTITIKMPKFATPLHVETQYYGEPCMWALVDVGPDGTETVMENREFEVYGTGHPIQEEKYSEVHHLGTFIMRYKNQDRQETSLVFHVFERRSIDMGDDE
jgi:hypothetical protein